ncbi:hypothetical protein Amet_2611 [Alkaliphilus metalliredigens QYMF]|uniref:Uncharacterized protein n=1 Tax=Alkaliphilus metalliredigens (strain QYMF) TaxID=293826 RepID=A6TRE5_ALKMQ|nr:hypothetical protein Amet_2611 [Alkaliphilus metalliredigens QYMF]
MKQKGDKRVSAAIKKQATDLAEYMEKEFGITPHNIDEKLNELKNKFYEKELIKDERCERVQ